MAEQESTTVIGDQPKPQTQAQPPSPPEPPKKAPHGTAEPEDKISFEEATKRFGDTFSGKKKPKKETEEPAKEIEHTKTGDEKAKLEKKDETLSDKDEKVESHKPKRSKKPSEPVEPALSETRLAEIAADAGARASAETITRIEKERTKADDKQAEDFKPPKEYTEKYAAFKLMAKAKPDKYEKLLEEFKAFVKEEDTYIKQWKRDHQGEAWNGEADEHNDFYQRVTPSYDEGDLRRAEINLELGETKKEIRKEVLDEFEPKLKELDELKLKETMRSLQPVIDSAERMAMGSILKAINPNFEKFVEPAELVKLKDEDPVAFDSAMAAATDAVPFVAEVTRLWKGNGAIKAQSDNPAHQYIFAYGTKMGELIKALPPEDQIRDGKKFATWDEFNQLSDAKKGQYWTISDQDLIERKLLDAQQIAKERFATDNKKHQQWAKREGLTAGNANNSTPKRENGKADQEAKQLPAKENNGSPSVGSRTQVSPNATPSPSSAPAWLEPFGKIMSGRKV